MSSRRLRFLSPLCLRSCSRLLSSVMLRVDLDLLLVVTLRLSSTALGLPVALGGAVGCPMHARRLRLLPLLWFRLRWRRLCASVAPLVDLRLLLAVIRVVSSFARDLLVVPRIVSSLLVSSPRQPLLPLPLSGASGSTLSRERRRIVAV